MRQRPFRPGFDHTVEAPPAVVSRSVEVLLEGDGALSGRSRTENMMLSVRTAERHFWSPWLHLQIIAHRSEEGSEAPRRSYVRGFFTPHPSLWSWFVMAYLASGVLIFFSGIWGFTQLQLGRSPYAFWLCVAFALIAGGLWTVSRVGRRLATEQMETLHAAVEEALASTGTVSIGAGDVEPPAEPVGARV